MKKTLFIFHFLPLEQFPPVLNLLNYFASEPKEFEIVVISTYPDNRYQLFENKSVKIIRLKSIDSSSSLIIKLYRYLIIYTNTLYHLLRLKPKVVCYFETYSSLPVLIYKWVHQKTFLFIHYHEIVTINDLEKGRTLNKWLNKLEKKFYRKAIWISQTNLDRIKIFAKEYNLCGTSKQLYLLPNYPPKYWTNIQKPKRLEDDKIKLLHIGSLSFEGMYLQQALDYFGNNELFQLDFYSYTKDLSIIKKIETYNNIEFRGGIDYEMLPTLKGNYDVGLVLYNGSSLNFTYNAPNKIFEYLALGMDVWCSDKLITAKNYFIDISYPKMLLIDFENLENFDYKKAINRKVLNYKETPYFCEEVYNKLLKKIDENFNT